LFEELKQLHKYKKPIESSRYHKQYEEGVVDYYIGISAPTLRKISKKYYKTINTKELNQLISSEIHEYRLLALIILTDQIKKANLEDQKVIVEYYLENIKYINNWDLVDVSAYLVLGRYLYNISDYSLLYEFAESDNLWIKRIGIVATNYLIRNNELSVTLDIVDILLKDTHDLIHKANGWMLRNLGDKDQDTLTEYIYTNYNDMPRTTLRYAIEHYQEDKRKAILRGDFTWK